MVNSFVIRVPASSANLACGFDVLGLALTIWLELQVEVADSRPKTKCHCAITAEGQGAEKISKDPEQNMITATALNVLRCHDLSQFPRQTKVHILNAIPLGRGLGSSGAAIVAGVMLADAVAGLNMSKDRMMEFCLVEENHPDNIGASLFGAFGGSFLDEVHQADQKFNSRTSNGTPDALNGSLERYVRPRYPGMRAIRVNYEWSHEIKVIAVIPDYEVKTDSARAVLPSSYAKEDVVFNLQRVALLPYLLGSRPLRAQDIHCALQDRMHQQHRGELVHGLERLIQIKQEDTPGLLGVFLSGAGPTVLALATDNFESIAQKMVLIIQECAPQEISCDWKLLDVANEGATVIRGNIPGTQPIWFTELFNRISSNIRVRV